MSNISKFVLSQCCLGSAGTRKSGLNLVDARSVFTLLHVAVESACPC